MARYARQGARSARLAPRIEFADAKLKEWKEWKPSAAQVARGSAVQHRRRTIGLGEPHDKL